MNNNLISLQRDESKVALLQAMGSRDAETARKAQEIFANGFDNHF